MKIYVFGFRKRNATAHTKADESAVVELQDPERRHAFGLLARGYFATWPHIERVRLYDEVDRKVGSYKRTSLSPRPKPVKKKLFRTRKAKKKRGPKKKTGWDAHRRGSGRIGV